MPWTLLSGGDSFEVFEKQLRVACHNGCSGFLVGRALWQEAVYLQGNERDSFLQCELSIDGKHCVPLQRATPNPGLNDMEQWMWMNTSIRNIKRDEEV